MLSRKKLCILFLKLVYKLKELFVNINSVKFETVNIIVKVVTSEIIIKKNINQGEELAIMQVVVADDTGCINAIFKNENIKFAKIGEELILRDAKVIFLNKNIFLVCDEVTNIFINSANKLNKINIGINYSKVKLTPIEINI